MRRNSHVNWTGHLHGREELVYTLAMDETKKAASRQRLYSALLFLCLYLIVIGIPYSRIYDNFYFTNLLPAGLKIILFAFGLWQMKREDFVSFPYKRKSFLLYLVFLPLALSNALVMLLSQKMDASSFVGFGPLCALLFADLATAMAEETVFRFMLASSLFERHNKVVALFGSALIFSLCHFIAIYK